MLVLNSSGEMSTCIIWTLGRKRGVLPKWSIQLSLAPRSKITSAFPRAVDLAGPHDSGLSSSTTPFPIGVPKKGIWVCLINSFIGSSALAYAAPFPTIINGDLAFLSNSTASFIFYGFAIDIST